MKILLIACGLFFIPNSFLSQELETNLDSENKFYFYWGWNRSSYSKSDIHFKGENYDFKLSNVIAKDRQSPFNLNTYLNPANVTIPQYNFRIGYFLNDHYNLSFGIDHMKYVVQDQQYVEINGEIQGTETSYDGLYNQDQILIQYSFLKFEHTDGLNYFNFALRRSDQLLNLKNIGFHITEGIGVGGLLPKTNAKLINNQRHDDFHLSGYGLNIFAGLNISFYDKFYIQGEYKGGFIHMPSIRTTSNPIDKASQYFTFNQINIVFGAYINIKKNRNE